MKYHYRIIDERYPDEVQCTSATWVTHTADSTPDNPIKGPFIGFDTKEEAWKAGKEEHTMLHMEDYCTIEVYAIAETVEEEDELEGHFFPGHEMWDE